MNAAALNDAIATSAARLRAGGSAPEIAVLLGSGWAPLAERVQDAVDVPYAALPAFPTPGVGGHAGQVRLGRLGGRPVAVLAGRQHAYETGEPDAMKGAIRTLAALDVQLLLQTNAAGSLEQAMPPGALMLVTDHLNIAQRSPLLHEGDDRRFVDMGGAYDAALGAQVQAVARARGDALHDGVYAWVLGPQFETPAEIRWLRACGAQAVGMSTVPETILARHAGMRVLALSLITNMAAGMADAPLSHARTLAAAQAAGKRAADLLEAVVAALAL